VKRRHFVGQVMLGSAVASFVRTPLAAPAAGGLRIKFIGMMGYVTRSDRSLLVAMPGEPRMGQYSHVPFLMARAGSAIARTLGFVSMPGVVAGAFDMELVDDQSDAFVFRCLDGADVEIASFDRKAAVDNRASQLAQMQQIAPGKRLRNNLRRWAQSTVTVQGGLLENSAAHPDAGKVWSFGSYKQQLTDATVYTNPSASVSLSLGTQISTFNASDSGPAELWVVSSAGPRTDVPNPKRLEHGHLLFEYFANAQAITPTCEDAEGRIGLATDLPCSSGSASIRGLAAAAAPPYTDLCPGGAWGSE
jgi:hypothetical protein